MNDEQLNVLRAQADSLGLSYHHRAGAAKIQKLIEDHLGSVDNIPEPAVTAEPQTVTTESVAVAPQLPKKKVVPLTEAEYKEEIAKENKKRVGALIRCRVTCMNPNKKNWNGEIISVGSAKLGTFKKFIPFNSGEPFHIPKIIYDMLVERKCTLFVESKNARGHRTKVGKMIDEFSIEVLEPLTANELSELAKQQAFAAGQGA